VRAYPSLSLSLSLSLSRLLNLARARSLSLSLLLSSFPLSLSLSLSLSLICGCNEASHGHGKCSGAPSILQHLMLALKHTRAHHDTHILLKDSCGQWVGGGAGVVLYVGCRWCQTGQLTMQCVVCGVQVVPDGPADHAVPRMEKGDIVKVIDGVNVSSLAHAKSLILGEPGTQVGMPPLLCPSSMSLFYVPLLQRLLVLCHLGLCHLLLLCPCSCCVVVCFESVGEHLE